jgi:hypothetical protein
MSVEPNSTRVRESIVEVPGIGSMIRTEILDHQAVVLEVHYRFPTDPFVSPTQDHEPTMLDRLFAPMPIGIGIGATCLLISLIFMF